MESNGLSPLLYRILLKCPSITGILPSLSQRRASVPRQIKTKALVTACGGELSAVKLRRSSSKTDLLPVDGGGTRSAGGSQEHLDSLASQQSGFLAKVTCWQQRIDPEAEVNLNRRKKQRPASIAGGEAVPLKAVGGSLKRVPSLGSLPVLPVGVKAAPLSSAVPLYLPLPLVFIPCV
jgi:hypothetical protein